MQEKLHCKSNLENILSDRRFFLRMPIATAAGTVRAKLQRRIRLVNGYRDDLFQTRKLADLVALISESGIPVELRSNKSPHKLSAISDAVRGGKVELGQVIISDREKTDLLSEAGNLSIVVRTRVWTGFKYFTEVIAWTPRNVTFAIRQWFASLPEAQRKAVHRIALFTEVSGWAASVIAADSIKELMNKGMRVEKASAQLLADLKRLGEKVAPEWRKEAGRKANSIFVPYYTTA